MDDWNDFGNVIPPPSTPTITNGQYPQSSTREDPYADSSQSSIQTFSDSSTPYFDGASTSNYSSSLHQPSHHRDYQPTTPPQQQNHQQSSIPSPLNIRNSSHSSPRNSQRRPSFLAAIPFLSASRQRRADRAAAAVIADANADANAVTTLNATTTTQSSHSANNYNATFQANNASIGYSNYNNNNINNANNNNNNNNNNSNLNSTPIEATAVVPDNQSETVDNASPDSTRPESQPTNLDPDRDRDRDPDPGRVPDPSSVNDEDEDEDVTGGVNDDIGGGSSDSEVQEPRSVIMGGRTRRGMGNNPLEEDDVIDVVGRDDEDPDHDEGATNDGGAGQKKGKDKSVPPRTYTPRRGDLDDVPDDYELNIEGFRFTAAKTQGSNASDTDGEPTSSPIASSLLKHLDKSYIKLEVISAKQIRGLLWFFNALLLISIIYTIIVIVLSNTIYKHLEISPFPAGILYDEQRQNGQGPVFVLKNNTTARFLQTYKSNSIQDFRFQLQGYYDGDYDDEENDNSLRVAYNSYEDAMYKFGYCPSDKPHRYTKCDPTIQFLKQTTSETPRQKQTSNSSSSPSSSSSSQSSPSSTSTSSSPSANTPSSNPRRTSGSRQIPRPRQAQNATPETHYTLFSIPNTFTRFPTSLKLTHIFISIFLALFFLLLSILFFIRLLRTKRRNITHEQIWVLILLLVTFLYFDVLENIIDATDAINIIQITNAIREDKNPPDRIKFSAWILRFSDVMESIRIASFTTFTYFYLWASLHSYRILDPAQRLSFTRFYLPKLAVLVPLLIYHLAVFHGLGLELSEIPLLSAPALAFIYAPFRIREYLGVEIGLAIVKSFADAFIIGIIFWEASKTMRVLEQAPYMKYRAKRVGFRFFLYINFMFYSCFFLLYWVTIFGRPVGDIAIRINPVIDSPRTGLTWIFTTGVWFLISGYVLCTAYVHLPYTSIGWISGWFRSSTLASSSSKWSRISSDLKENEVVEETKPARSLDGSTKQSSDQSPLHQQHASQSLSSSAPTSQPHPHHDQPSHPHWKKHNKSQNETTWSSNDDEAPLSIVDNDAELQQQIVEPITYRKRESKDSLELKANCFTMQTHVIMFNFAWYVYYYGTPKLEKFRPRENPLPFEFIVDRHVKSGETDTQALVLDCTDRIIVTFKGTTSMKNLRTSLRVNHDMLRNVVRLNADGEDESDRLKKLFGIRYTSAKIHQGFSTAYLSVMDEVVSRVRALRDKKVRPVFLTGHSLGGALATLCSLDLWVKLNISRREIFVSTFGSPRVGNAYFAAVYREVVPLHWRIVVDPDMIARLPRVGYTHVGKKVVLTPHGEMIIDPSALEQRPWSGEAAGFAYHRKASYLLAMRAWCVRNHGMTYTPVFWPFPVRPEDERRFAGAFDNGEDEYDPDSSSNERHGRKVASKIIKLDAMVDALGGGHDEIDNMAAVEKWARLTRRVLLNEKLGGATSVQTT